MASAEPPMATWATQAVGGGHLGSAEPPMGSAELPSGQKRDCTGMRSTVKRVPAGWACGRWRRWWQAGGARAGTRGRLSGGRCGVAMHQRGGLEGSNMEHARMGACIKEGLAEPAPVVEPSANIGEVVHFLQDNWRLSISR